MSFTSALTSVPRVFTAAPTAVTVATLGSATAASTLVFKPA